MQQTQDELYEMSLKGQVFTQLMDKIRSPENIKLAYSTIKKNKTRRHQDKNGGKGLDKS